MIENYTWSHVSELDPKTIACQSASTKTATKHYWQSSFRH